MSFINLHNHDALGSLLDSIQMPKDIVKYAKENNQYAIALTNHGYMTSYIEFVKECSKEGIKPIVGCEVYEVDDMYFKSDTKDNRQIRNHLVLLAKNKIGLQNLIKIVSAGCTDGFYIKPRIDINYIKNNSLGSGIVCMTACQAGRLSRYVTCDEFEKANIFVNNLKAIFDNVFIEIQSHLTDEQIKCNKKIVQFARQYEHDLIVTTDSHMTRADQQDVHSIFVEIGESREAGEIYKDCYLQTEEEVKNKLTKGGLPEDVIIEAINNTKIVADMVEDNIDFGINQGNQMPIIQIEEGFSNSKDYLRHLVYSNFDKKFGHMSEEEQQKRKDRIEQELPVLYALDYTDYFIMLYMLTKKAKERNLPLGYSRGSGAGCLCLFLLEVTQIDSVKWELDFSRFANLGRKSLADYDMDVSKRRRKELIEISEELFGKDKVAPIATFNTLSTKVAIRDIGKVLNEKENSPYYNQIPYKLRDDVAKMIPTVKTLNELGEEEEKEALLKDILNKNEAFKDIYDKFPLWFQYVMQCEGLPKSMGRHAAGTLITPKPITEYCPVCFDNEHNIMVQLEMHNAMDDLNLVKMDFLGLRTLDVVDDCLKMAGLTWDDVDINHLDLDDKKVFDEVYKKGETIGVFQMESNEAKKMCIEANADNINDIVAINAANRPATKESFPEYCKNKIHPEQASILHEDLKDILGKTYYILLYQEQALQLFRYAGFPEEEVDNARRAIGKKLKDKMALLETQFKTNLINDKGWTKEQADSMWELILKQSSYSFNQSHSVSYGLLSYLTAYLKVHYPKEFMSACLTSQSENIDKISTYINECHRIGIEVLPPNINHSNKNFTPMKDSNTILFGLLAVKGMGGSAIEKLLENRPYRSLKDLNERFGDKKSIIILIKSGAIPCKDKMQELKRFAELKYEKRNYKSVSTLPTHQNLLMNWDINVNDYKIGKKIDKEKVLELYNDKRKIKFDIEENNRHSQYLSEFYNKYALDKNMWEFETLSMFLSYDPLKELTKKYIVSDWFKAKQKQKVTMLAVITGIDKKKDRNGNIFAFVNFYTSFGIIEGTIWASTYSKCLSNIKRGQPIAVIGKKDNGMIIVEDLMSINEWANVRKIQINN